MAAIRIRAKHQITLPMAIVQQADLREDDALEVSYVNGVIMLVPRKRRRAQDDVMNFAGIAGDIYGKTPAEIDETIQFLRDEWER